MVCPACQAPHDASARFCVECGASLGERCPECGAECRPEHRFCAACGAALRERGAPRPVGVAETASGSAAPAAELRVVSVLFVDLVGFTSLAESRDAEDVRELLDRYFDTAQTIIGRYGGVVQKFVGDAVMAVWGSPATRENDAELAVRAALDLVEAVSVFAEEVGTPELEARAGVVTGRAATTRRPHEGLVVGDRVNTAARIQAAALPGTVYVDEQTRQASSAAIAYENAGEQTVKGKAEPVAMWRALRAVAGVGGSRIDAGLEAPLVGRTTELRLLKELFHASVERGGAALVAVAGPAGVGKSRLRREFEHYVDGLAETVLWHSGRCLSYGDGVAYWALAEMIRQRLDIAEETPADEAARKLALGLERWIPDARDRAFITPRLGVLIGVAQPGLGRAELFAGWRLFFERLAEHEPVVLAFEDLQWADDGLLDFIEHLLDWSAARPIFVLGLARPELAERRRGWPPARPAVTPLYLERLDDRAMRELLDSVVTDLPAPARQEIVAQAEGIPLFALETVRALVDRGVVAEGERGLVLTGDVGELEIPATLSSLLAARLDALEPDERALVKDLAVIGGSFARATIGAVTGLPDDRLDALLASLVRKQVLAVRADPLSPDRGQYVFAQTLLRAVAYGMLSRGQRKPRHLAMAAHLREAFANDGEEVAEVIAAHCLDAYRAARDDPDAEALRQQALAALVRAAQRALAVGAPETAERAYRTALELAADEREHSELMEAAGDSALRAGRLEVARELLEAAAGQHAAAGRRRAGARVTSQIGRVLRMLGRGETAIERLRAALATLDGHDVALEVAALNAALGSALLSGGHLDEAAPVLERALAAAEALDDPVILCQALIDKGVLFNRLHRRHEARGLLELAAGIAERHTLGQELLRAQFNSAVIHMEVEPLDARGAVEAPLATARRLGDRAGESIAASLVMRLLLRTGRWQELERMAGELLTGPGADRPDVEDIYEVLGRLHAMRGQAREARACLLRIRAWRDSDDVDLRALHAALEGLVALAEGRPEDAVDVLASAAREAPEALTSDILPEAIDAALEVGRRAETGRLVEMLDRRPPGHLTSYLRAHLARARGVGTAASDDAGAVEPALGDAIERFGALGSSYWRARAQTDLAGWLIDRGRSAEATVPLQAAMSALEALGARPALARARMLLSGMPSGAAA